MQTLILEISLADQGDMQKSSFRILGQRSRALPTGKEGCAFLGQASMSVLALFVWFQADSGHYLWQDQMQDHVVGSRILPLTVQVDADKAVHEGRSLGIGSVSTALTCVPVNEISPVLVHGPTLSGKVDISASAHEGIGTDQQQRSLQQV